ncbi:transcriptional regulator, GntR family [Micrococcales bacterium KH10]|nr:transcriptional regulator, GntR family [Micrococcales bacterium KH10]
MNDVTSLPWEAHKPARTAKRIAESVGREIVDGSLSPGEVLTEVVVAERFGVSRTPAREAMLQLQRWGLVRLLPKKGALVTAVSAGERSDLLDIRATWEARAVTLLEDDPSGRDALVTSLNESIRTQQEALDSGNLLQFAAEDFGFHVRIMDAAGNRVVSELLEDLGPRFARLTYLAVNNNESSAHEFHREHIELVELIRNGASAAYERAVRAHISSGHFGTTS